MGDAGADWSKDESQWKKSIMSWSLGPRLAGL